MLDKVEYLAFACVFFVCVSIRQIESLKFLAKPQNTTIQPGHPLRLICRINLYDDDGVQWHRGEEEKVIFSTINGDEVTHLPGFEVDRPDNQTFNLVIRDPSSSFVDIYCCQHTNGHGESACAYVTEKNETLATEVTQEPVTSVLPTAEVGKSDDSQYVIIGSVLCGVAIVTLVVVCCFCQKCPLYKCRLWIQELRNPNAGTKLQKMNKLQKKEAESLKESSH